MEEGRKEEKKMEQPVKDKLSELVKTTKEQFIILRELYIKKTPCIICFEITKNPRSCRMCNVCICASCMIDLMEKDGIETTSLDIVDDETIGFSSKLSLKCPHCNKNVKWLESKIYIKDYEIITDKTETYHTKFLNPLPHVVAKDLDDLVLTLQNKK